jgi:quercetin dioxygenase-like cupin family protein
MFVRSLADVRASGREVVIAGGSARTARFLTADDGVGFTFSDVSQQAGAEARLWYKHHWEANYILAGTGELEEVATGQRWRLEPGTIYVVGPDDRHIVRAATDLRLISVFNPPLRGDENHDADGSYPPTGPIPPGPGG